MEIENWQEITIESDCFQEARDNFDVLLQRLLKRMEQNNSDEGSITLKVNINLITDFVSDENGKAQRIRIPVLKQNVQSTVPVKDSFDGKQETGMELIYDEKLGRYVLKHVSEGGQRSIFDPDFADIINGEATVVNEQPALPDNPMLIENKESEGTENGEDGCSGGSYGEGEESKATEDKSDARGDTEAIREPQNNDYGCEEA